MSSETLFHPENPFSLFSSRHFVIRTEENERTQHQKGIFMLEIFMLRVSHIFFPPNSLFLLRCCRERTFRDIFQFTTISTWLSSLLSHESHESHPQNKYYYHHRIPQFKPFFPFNFLLPFFTFFISICFFFFLWMIFCGGNKWLSLSLFLSFSPLLSLCCNLRKFLNACDR